ncbi:dual specificity protein phosphatase 12-like isoform X2 [Mytilus edulis]|uniref:dual specificity protein phosphatase 12-like isoform X2 n=1 Tax=Mytilus edulis TaxID=6550 RepID=UPI0039EFC13B
MWIYRTFEIMLKRMALDLDVIVDNLYVGSQQATKDPSMLLELGVTHVVTVSDGPIDKIVNSGFFKYKFIEGIDFDITDLLQRFPEVTAFIEEGVKSGAVLVHCVAGVSRSVTMVMAYLMEKNGMSFDDALKLVQQKRKYANPNDGFIKQLKLYEKMKCRLDPSDEEYRVYRLSSLAITMQGHQPKDAGMFLPGDLTDTPTANDSDIIFRCKKCRQPLFNRSCFYKHTVGPGEAAFDWRGASNTEKSTEICDKSIFIHPVQWMKQSIIDTEGKLSCPKCSAKVGSYVWHGEQCPCGEWVIPAFHIQTSKVDECKPIQTDIRNRVEPGQTT